MHTPTMHYRVHTTEYTPHNPHTHTTSKRKGTTQRAQGDTCHSHLGHVTPSPINHHLGPAPIPSQEEDGGHEGHIPFWFPWQLLNNWQLKIISLAVTCQGLNGSSGAKRLLLSHSVTQSLSHSVTQSLSHSVTQSLSHSVTQSLSHSVTQNWRARLHFVEIEVRQIYNPPTSPYRGGSCISIFGGPCE